MRQEVASLIEREDILFLVGAPPCTVFSSMQNINQKHNVGELWEMKYQQGLTHLEFAVNCIGRESPGGDSSYMNILLNLPGKLPVIQELEKHPGVQIVTGDRC